MTSSAGSQSRFPETFVRSMTVQRNAGRLNVLCLIASLRASLRGWRMSRPNVLSAFWLPFTPNRNFRCEPRILVCAGSGLY